MLIEDRKKAFIALGEFLSQFTTVGIVKKDNIPHNDLFFDAFKMQIKRAQEVNGWFTQDNVLFSLQNWSEALTEENLNSWLNAYDFSAISPKKVAVIMAGNIPMVGFHDFLSVVMSGHHILAKQSSNDTHFIPLAVKYLEYLNPEFKETITITQGELKDFDAVIATGSNNTARYFDFYFGKYPNIIRRNRNSVAVITGKESEEELVALGDDIFRYFGLGCRNVSKIFVPRDYDFDLIFKAVYNKKDIINYERYANNYDYNKAVYLMSLFDLRENGFLVLKEDESYTSPISTLFYEYYDSLEDLEKKLEADEEKIQCVVAKDETLERETVAFGNTQKPRLWDYADGVNTLEFLIGLK
ncbi:acyl-CoA reductase [Aureivirga sp. CE67]|uniref:acyl-CoA reductase n=1 Tax=Aureivirga sp. CE67 TaxID=1788983 RepID=UPI0018CB6EBE|nr:acyl-CoA reductase [Aureivirga sp. CE67]